MKEPMLTAVEFAQRTGYHPGAVKRIINRGDLKFERRWVNSRLKILIPESEVERYKSGADILTPPKPRRAPPVERIAKLQAELRTVRQDSLAATRAGEWFKVAILTIKAAGINRAIAEAEDEIFAAMEATAA